MTALNPLDPVTFFRIFKDSAEQGSGYRIFLRVPIVLSLYFCAERFWPLERVTTEGRKEKRYKL